MAHAIVSVCANLKEALRNSLGVQFVRPGRKHVKEGLVPDCSKAMFQTQVRLRGV